MGNETDVLVLRRLGNKVRGGRATAAEVERFNAANERAMARQSAAAATGRWYDMPVARACWEGDAAALARTGAQS